MMSMTFFVSYVPIWVSNAAVGAALSEYGTVIGAIPHGKVKVRDNLFVASGVRFAAFKLLPGRSIPSYIKTCDGKGTFRVFHQGQQPTCRTCSANNHLARDCPSKNKPQKQTALTPPRHHQQQQKQQQQQQQQQK